MESGIGFVLIKPAAIELSLDGYVVRELVRGGLSVMTVSLNGTGIACYLAGPEALKKAIQLREEWRPVYADSYLHVSRSIEELIRDLQRYLPNYADEVTRLED